METAYFGGGCFWCVEAVYMKIRGIESVTSGYAGGGTDDTPTYHNHGKHAEVIKVVFDPSIVGFEKLVEIFWHVHDPTTLNQQGNDVGESYRSIILTTSDQQLATALDSKKTIARELWGKPIVTEIQSLDAFTEAEDYHQDYFTNNPGNPYCQLVINPKVQKFQTAFADLLQ